MATPQPPAVPPAPPIESSSADTVDLGVLLVHGIGEQAQGDKLTRFAEPIVEWIRDWLQRGATAGTLFASSSTVPSKPDFTAASIVSKMSVMSHASRMAAPQSGRTDDGTPRIANSRPD